MSGETKQRISELEAEIARLKEAQPTLRDQFAMAVVSAACVEDVDDRDKDKFAKYCYTIADAMLQARRIKGDS